MIEVEKSFDVTKQQTEKIIGNSEFLGEVINHDIYYDYPDLRLAKSKIKLRFRNNEPELKIAISSDVDREIETEDEITKYLGIEGGLVSFVKDNMIELTNYKNTRRKYRKGEIYIDIDSMDFGLESCDMEVMVESEKEIPTALKKIEDLAASFGLSAGKESMGKRQTYLKKFKPEIYKELYK